MAAASYLVHSFLGGEISAFAQGDITKPSYKISLATCLNAFPTEIGPWCPRPGTAFAGATDGGKPGRTISWAFEQASPVTLEFTDGNVCFRNGVAWTTTNDTKTISGISTANPAVVSGAPNWPTGARVFFGLLGATCPLLQNRQFLWTHLSSSTGSLTDAITGATIDGSTLGVGSLAATATISRIQDITTPYVAGAWSSLRMVQAETTGILLNGAIAPQALTVPTLPGLNVSPQFALAAATFNDGPYLDAFTNGVQATPNQKTGIVQLTLSFPAYDATKSYKVGDFVTASSVNYKSLIDQNINNTPVSSPSDWAAVSAGAAINNGQGLLGTDIGRLVRLYSEPPLWLIGSTYGLGAVVSYNPTGQPGAATYWQSTVAGNVGNIPSSGSVNISGTLTIVWELVAPGAALPSIGDFTNPIAASGPAQWTWGKIVSLLNFIPGGVSGVAQVGSMTGNGGLAAAFNGTTSQNASSSAAISAGPFSPTLGGNFLNGFAGQNYSGTSATAYAIDHATIYPSNDLGFGELFVSAHNVQAVWTITFVLYGKSTAPAAYNDGTVLGTTSIATGGVFPAGVSGLGADPVTITSSDKVTTYPYVWIAIETNFSVISLGGALTLTLYNYLAQVQFFSGIGTGTGGGCNVELIGPPLLYTAPIITWRLGAYSATTGYPTNGCYAAGRLWLGGAIPNRFDACYANGINGSAVNFAPTDQYGNVTAAHAISETFNDDGTNPIFAMTPVIQNSALRGIVMHTQQREWFVFPPGNGGFAPTNIDSVPATHVGSANVLPVQTEHTIIFVQRYSIKLMEYFSDVFSGKYTAPNLADKAQHITRAGIAEIAYTYAATPIIWGRCGDGTWFGCTYKRDTLMTAQGPTYYAWHRQQLGSGRVVESLCAGPSVGGNLDALTMVTNNAAVNVRHVEVLTDALDELTPLAQSWFLDDAINPSSTVASTAAVTYAAWAAGTTYSQGQVVTYTDQNVYTSLVGGNIGNVPLSNPTQWLLSGSAPFGGLTLNGLWHLNGSMIAVFAGGLDCGNYLVLNGSVFVPFGDGVASGTGGGLFTAAFAAGLPANQIVVGFTYNCDGQLVRPQAPQDAGTRTGPALGKRRRFNAVAALFSNLAMSNSPNQTAISFGRDFNNLKPAVINTSTAPNQKPLSPGQSFSGVWRDTVQSESDYNGQVCWRISRPLPGNIVAIEPILEGQD